MRIDKTFNKPLEMNGMLPRKGNQLRITFWGLVALDASLAYSLWGTAFGEGLNQVQGNMYSMFQCCSEMASCLACSSLPDGPWTLISSVSCLPTLCFGAPSVACVRHHYIIDICFPCLNPFWSVSLWLTNTKGVLQDLLLRRLHSFSCTSQI